MSRDEFDNANSAPVPPYERHWRHPSEFADDARRHHENITAPPPLSKRIALVSITASILCSAAILAVTIPKGVQQLASDDPVPNTTLARSPLATKVKNATAAVGITNDDTSVRALAVGDSNLIIAPGDTINEDGMIAITTNDGQVLNCHVLARDENSGLAILIMPQSDTDNSRRISGIVVNDSDDKFDINDLQIIEPITGIAFEGQLSISSSATDPFTTLGAVPLNVDVRINGVAVVVNKKAKIVGVAFTRNHSTWMLPMKTVRKLINDARAAGDALQALLLQEAP